MKNIFLSYDYTSKIFDVFAGKTSKGKIIHTFSLVAKVPSRIDNEAIYKWTIQIMSDYQHKGYTVYFDRFIARLFVKFEPIFKPSRNIEHERSLVETTVIQID